MIENRLYRQEELETCGINTPNYKLNLIPGCYYAVLDLKASQRYGGDIRAFFTFEDQRKVFALIKWFDTEKMRIEEIAVGTKVLLTYSRKSGGNVYMTDIEEVESW